MQPKESPGSNFYPLSFLGCGSAFSFDIGNNIALFTIGSTLFLIDCGASIMGSLVDKELGKSLSKGDIKQLVVFITHMHPDHVGGLGEMVFYCKYILKIPITIFFENRGNKIEEFLIIQGVYRDIFKIHNSNEYTINFTNDENNILNDNKTIKGLSTNATSGIPIKNFRAIPRPSLHTFMSQEVFPTFSYIFEFEFSNGDKKSVYYSGDSRALPQNILTSFENNEINTLYQDTYDYQLTKEQEELSVHFSFEALKGLINGKLREKCVCMHLDNLPIKKTVAENFNSAHNFLTPYSK